MKTNKAPEKIYIDSNLENRTWLIGKGEISFIEYTRTDVFIEKVESFLKRKDDRDYYTIGYIRKHLKEIIKEVGL